MTENHNTNIGCKQRWALALAALCILGCHGKRAKPFPPKACPSQKTASLPLPDITPEHYQVEYWLKRIPQHESMVLSEEQRLKHNQRMLDEGDTFAFFDLHAFHIDSSLQPRITRRLSYIRKQMQQGKLSPRSTQPFDTEEKKLDDVSPTYFSIVTENTPLFCTPNQAALYKKPDPYRLNRNLCSTARQGEILALQAWNTEWWLSFSEYTFGFTPKQNLDPKFKKAPTQTLQKGPLTRADFLRSAFSFLDQPYGWAGDGGGLDCSRLVQQSFAQAGLRMPRNSAMQLKASHAVFEVPHNASLSNRLNLIEAAHRRGIVLLLMPGHIMIYVGHNDQGIPVVLHAFMDYKVRCPKSTKQTRYKVAKVALSSLYLGHESIEGSLLARITHIGMIGSMQADLR